MKKQKGITLVALIITIVVLLILAVVSIGTVQNSGIIGHAKDAAGSFNQAKTNEVSEIQRTEEYINSIIPSNEEELITKEYVSGDVKQILNIKGEKYEMTTLYKGELMSGPIEILLLANIDSYGYTINNRSGDNNLYYVVTKEDNTIQPIAFSEDKTRIYQGEVEHENKVLKISTYYME